MALTYSQYQTDLATLMATTTTDPNFVQILPLCIDYAELSCYRDLDLSATIVTDSSANVTANVRTFTLPSTNGRFVTVDGINIFTPVSTTTTRNPVTPVSRSVVDALWPSSTVGNAVPTMFHWLKDGNAGSQTVIFGPAPDQAYTVEVIGTIRPTALSATNTTTFLSNYFDDLFMAASMIFMSGYQKNFGAQSDDPRMSASWKEEYARILAACSVEEARKKFSSQGWTAKQPMPLAATPR